MQVSIIVPTRNRCSLLAMTLRCALRQRDVEVEIIVVDEASTDQTPAVISAMADRRIRVLRHDTPRGVSAARNHGVAEARGEWVAFLDDDDLWAPDKLSCQLASAQATGRDWVYAGCVNVNERLEVIHGRPPLPPAMVVDALPRSNVIPAGASNVVVRRAMLLGAGPFDPRLYNTEDWEMWIRLSRQGPPAWVCRPLVGYRMHASSSSLNVSEIKRGVRLIQQLHATTADWGGFYWWIAQLCVRRSQRAEALRYYALAMLRGRSREVTSDLATLAGGALNRCIGRRAAVPHRRADAVWEDQALAWIRELRALQSCAMGLSQ